eukprot:2274565-Prymnesium_polylepis.1
MASWGVGVAGRTIIESSRVRAPQQDGLAQAIVSVGFRVVVEHEAVGAALEDAAARSRVRRRRVVEGGAVQAADTDWHACFAGDSGGGVVIEGGRVGAATVLAGAVINLSVGPVCG